MQGGFKLYSYVADTTKLIDPLGLVGEETGGYNVYGLYNVDANGKAIGDPYYIGITNDLDRRTKEHLDSGRLDENNSVMKPLDENVTYGEARGYEQAYIEHYETKTGTIGEEISATNRGNKVNSFDHDNQTRDRDRQQYFEDAYEEKSKELKGGCKK